MAKVLIIEDEPQIVRTLRLYLERAGYATAAVTDGAQAIPAYRQERPDLVLLDLNMPRKDGREVLTEIKADARLSSIPVVILTTSEAEEDILRSYDLHANCYITKPVDLDQFIRVIRSIERFWLTIVQLPAE